MGTEFNGFTKGVIGKKLPADTTLNNMKKSELVELLHIAQHNYDTLMWFYTNAMNVNMDKWEEQKNHDKEIRDEALKEFIKRCDKACEFYEGKNAVLTREMILEIAEQMKEVGE